MEVGSGGVLVVEVGCTVGALVELDDGCAGVVAELVFCSVVEEGVALDVVAVSPQPVSVARMEMPQVRVVAANRVRMDGKCIGGAFAGVRGVDAAEGL